MLYLPDHNILFASDSLNNGFVPAPLESLDGWLTTLEIWRGKYPADALVYPGHGPEDTFERLLANQRAYLQMLRKEVKAAIQNDVISTKAVENVALKFERAFPHTHGVGGNARFAVIKFVVEHVAKQYGAKPETETEFR